jgi:hypothetical protein
MRSRSLFAAVALTVCTAGIAAALTSQDKTKPAQTPPTEKSKPAPASAPTAPPGMDPAVAEKMAAYAKPGAEHEMLKSRVGKWTGKGKFWMSPEAPPMESAIDSEYSLIMDRYLANTTHSDMMGMPFEGHGLTAFDNIKKKYMGTWIDNCATGIMSMEGTYDAASKTMTMTGEGPDAVAGKYSPMKIVEKAVDANSFVMEMHSTDAKSGKLFKCMEITYTRAK